MKPVQHKKTEDKTKTKIYVILKDAPLETIKTKHGIELANADTHATHLKSLKKDPASYRPDIVHQTLLQLLDSPLCKAGHLEIYVQTVQNVLIYISPTVRLPRSFKRFGGLMVQLLYKLKIRAADGADVLLKVVKNPVTDHVPAGCRKFAINMKSDLVNLNEFAVALPDESVTFVLSCNEESTDPAWVEKSISVSQFTCSSPLIGNKITSAFEGKFGIL